jgi:P4 family phage/plasmid primase-like protien
MNDKPLLFGKGTSTETYAQITHDKADTATIYIGEGYATTYTAHHLMNALCYVAGSGSNLPYVVRQVKERFPESRIVALIDNGKTGHKVGHELANDGVSFVMPPKSKGGDDLNDYFVERGEQATKDLIQEQLTNPLPISEFNEQTPTNKADQKKNVTLINTIKQVSADTALFADMVRVASGLSVSGDEYQISQAIKARFEGRLAILSGESHFFCGIKWHYIDDSMLKRAVGHILSEGCDDATTGNRIKSVSQILQDNLERLGEKNPSSSKIIFADKILDTNNWQFEPHNADHLNTRTLSVNYPQTNECPQFLNFLNGIFSDEPERINLLQEIMGYALLPDNLNIQKALMFVGASRAGKGVIFELMKAIMRDGAMGSVKLNEIDNHKQQSGMLASSICVDSDAVSPPANSCRTIMGLLKVITANEPLSIQQLYKQRPLETRLDCKVLIIANQSLTLIDDSGAMADRWMPLVFTKSMLGKEDVTLKDRLLTELEGIAGWALDGLKRLIQTRQFTMPKSSLDFLENLRADSGSLSAFITDELEFSADFRVSEKDLWNAYHLWSIQTGVEQHKRRHFLTNLETALRPHNVQRKQSLRITPGGKPQRGFDGIRLRVTGASNF